MKTKFKTFWVIICGIIGLIYILNPTAGVIELIPDNIPLIGNLDEAAAVFLLLGCLRYFRVDVTKFFNR
jgi:uncharacterized membrane protein YkvA (DUF1232 family)